MPRVNIVASVFVLAWVFPIWLSGMMLWLGRTWKTMLRVPFLLGPVQMVFFFFLYVYAQSPH